MESCRRSRSRHDLAVLTSRYDAWKSLRRCVNPRRQRSAKFRQRSTRLRRRSAGLRRRSAGLRRRSAGSRRRIIMQRARRMLARVPRESQSSRISLKSPVERSRVNILVHSLWTEMFVEPSSLHCPRSFSSNMSVSLRWSEAVCLGPILQTLRSVGARFFSSPRATNILLLSSRMFV